MRSFGLNVDVRSGGSRCTSLFGVVWDCGWRVVEGDWDDDELAPGELPGELAAGELVAGELVAGELAAGDGEGEGDGDLDLYARACSCC